MEVDISLSTVMAVTAAFSSRWMPAPVTIRLQPALDSMCVTLFDSHLALHVAAQNRLAFLTELF